MVDHPITSGYRNDAMRIDTGGVSICRGDSLTQATGLTPLEQDFESALAAMPSGYGESVYEGLRYTEVSRRKKGTNLFA
ncbi:hypothetical protein [Bradyrhizobium sp. URHC0002]